MAEGYPLSSVNIRSCRDCTVPAEYGARFYKKGDRLSAPARFSLCGHITAERLIGMKYRIGVCEWSLPVMGPFGVTMAGKAGFTGIQLGDLNGAAAGFPMNRKCIQEGYLQAAEEAGVALQALHPYGLQRQGLMMALPGTAAWDDVRRSVSMCIEACADMHIPECMFSSFFSSWVNSDWEMETFSRHLSYACDVAEDKGVIVSYESALTVPKMYQMMELTGGRCKICYDMRNPLTIGCGYPKEDISALGLENISHFHIKDGFGNMKEICLVGDGISDLAGQAQLIKNLGYEGWLISENDYSQLASEKDCDFLELAAEDVKRIRKLFPEA